MNNKQWMIVVPVAIVVAAVSFFAGIKYQQSQAPARGANFAPGRSGNFNGQRAANGSNARFRPINGQIIASDDKSITVQLTDGSSKIVLLSGNATISQSTAASASDLKNGQMVAVFGTENSDGTLSAQNIQLNPPNRSAMSTPSASPR